MPPLTRALDRGRPKPLLKTWVQEDTPSRLVGYGVSPRRTCSFSLKFGRFYRTSKSAWLRVLYVSRLGWREPAGDHRYLFARQGYYSKTAAVLCDGLWICGFSISKRNGCVTAYPRCPAGGRLAAKPRRWARPRNFGMGRTERIGQMIRRLTKNHQVEEQRFLRRFIIRQILSRSRRRNRLNAADAVPNVFNALLVPDRLLHMAT